MGGTPDRTGKSSNVYTFTAAATARRQHNLAARPKWLPRTNNTEAVNNAVAVATTFLFHRQGKWPARSSRRFGQKPGIRPGQLHLQAVHTALKKCF